MIEKLDDNRTAFLKRRSVQHPPLWLGFLLLLLGFGGAVFAHHHRKSVTTRFSDVIAERKCSPAELRRIKAELAEMDRSRDALQRELNDRLKFAASLKSGDFCVSIDTGARKLRFYYGDTVLREADVKIGGPRFAPGGAQSQKQGPVKGVFTVQTKLVHYAWPVPNWVYAMNGEPVPAKPAVVPDGLGAYLIRLPNGLAIHSQPADASPLHGAEPGSYMVSEDVLKAIWPRIHAGTQVYVF